MSAVSLAAATLTFYPDQDTIISEYYPNVDHSDAYLLAGLIRTCDEGGHCDRDGDGYVRMLPLIRFDLSALPPDSLVVSCELHLECWGMPGGKSVRVYAYRITSPWDEHAYWYSKPSWTDTLAPYATFHTIGPVTMTHSQLAEMAQMWESGTAPNYGLLIWPQEQDYSYNVRFHSRETAPTQDTRPHLKITYLPRSPQVGDIPDRSVREGDSFPTFDLDDYVTDADHTKAELTWSYSGAVNLTVTIDPVTHVVTTAYPPGWCGAETVTFRATDPDNLWGEDSPTFAVAQWPQATGAEVRSAPALGDLDGDGMLEVVVGSADGNVYVWRADGSSAPGWPQATGGQVHSSPVLGDLDGDRLPEVIIGSADGSVYAWHGDGTPVTGWPKAAGGQVRSSPALGHLDSDSLLDMVVGSYDGNVYAWGPGGAAAAGWPQSAGQVHSSPALGDLDGDGALEVIVGSGDSNVYAWHGDGTAVAGWPRATQNIVNSSPALGDLEGDGAAEVVVGSHDGSVYAWHGDGTPAAGWPRSAGGEVHSSPALGRLDGDDLVDVVVGSADGKVYAWSGGGGPLAGWPKTTGGGVLSSPALGDVDEDGALDVVVGSQDGKVYAWRADGMAIAGWPRVTGGEVSSSPALADLNGDGLVDVAVGSDDGHVHVWLGIAATDRRIPWPMFRHDSRHTGNYHTGPFSDVPSDWWACDEIEACVRAGVVWGYLDGSYRPGAAVSRDQMAVFISRALAGGDENVPTGPLDATFDDVPTNHWAYKYVEYCVGGGVVQGYTPVTYRPTVIVSRDQMAVFISRAVAGGDEFVPDGPLEATFDDVPSGYWAYKYVEYCAAEGIARGYDPVTYRPLNPVTRDQMAVYIARAFGLL